MTVTISALFDRMDDAESVATHLRVHDKVEPGRISLHRLDNAQPVEGDGFWASLGSLLGGEPARHRYEEGVRRGACLVQAEVDEGIAEHVMGVFNRHGAVDLEERAASWRDEGWQEDPALVSNADMPVNTSFAVGAASMGGTAVPMVDTTDPTTGPGSGNR